MLAVALGFDATGRLVEASKGVSVVRSGYSAQGQRVTRQVVGGSTAGITLFAYDTQGRPLGAYVPDSGAPGGFRVLEEYVHLDSWRVVAVVHPDATTGMANPRFFPVLSDHLGTPRKVLDGQTGEARWAWDAKEPFGFELPNEVPTSGLAAFSFDLRFPGQRADPETGLFQNGFRDYHPGLGRYVESDPLGLEAGWNTYAYVSSSPSGLLDPFGLSQRDIDRIRSITNNYVHEAVANGERTAFLGLYSGRLNAFYNNATGGAICSTQATQLASILQSLDQEKIFDDTWEFRYTNGLTHFWIEGTSSNKKDPIIRIDPWVNSVHPRDFPRPQNFMLYLPVWTKP